MNKTEKKGEESVQQRGKQGASPAPNNDQDSQTKSKSEDIPGAEGPLSAGADEDTYD